MDSGEHLLDMINEILDIAKIELNKKEFNLGKIIKNFLQQ